ncbi:MAG: discoidin domain-containing protein [Myxococcota bacterium]|jgi:hypothetical protein|nr:discoidin domain-containing protein [Myxococcota bacterium]
MARKGSVVTISGQLFFEDGVPATGRVALVAEASALDFFAGLLTVGLYCLEVDESGKSKCAETTHLATLDGEGRFSFKIPEAETRRSFYDQPFALYAKGRKSADGSSASVRVGFTARHEDNPLPPITLLEEGPSLRQDAGGLQLEARWPEELACMREVHRLVQFHSNAGDFVWEQAPGPVDPRLLEDFDGTMRSVSARDNEGWGGISNLVLQSKPSPFVSNRLMPVSRGATCEIDGAAAEPCPFTDASTLVYSIESSAVIDLGAARALSLLVLRAASQLSIEYSEDGTNWRRLDYEDNAAIVTVSVSATARYLRLSPDEDSSSALLGELSAW